jgi:hypothetical protein
VLTTAEELLERVGAGGAVVTQQDLPHNQSLTPGIWQVRTRAGQLAVLKYTRSDRERGSTPWDTHWTAGDQDPQRWNYWCREPLAYQHELPAAYAGSGLAAPACLGAHVDDTDAVLLLDWAGGQPGETWPVAGYAPAAEALGRAQAPFLLGRPAPAFPWLSRRFLREYSTDKPVDFDLLDDDEVWAHPLAREIFPAGLREGVLLVHASRERLYQISESLPRTLCHLDFWPKNLIREPGGRLALLDWSFAGLGAIGEDAGNVVPDASFDHFVPAADLPRLEQVVFDGYLRGLREAGWDGDPALVRLGMWSSAVKYDWLAALTLAELGWERQFRYGGAGEIDAGFKFRERSGVLAFNAGWARQAQDLADQLGL